MVQTIYIRLPTQQSAHGDAGDMLVEWCVSDGLGRPAVQRDTLSAVLETSGNRSIVLLVPSEDVVLTETDLPIRQRAKLLQAVPYSLEEQFAEDVDQLHFAVGERQANGRIPVYGVAHQRMQQWLAPFEERGLTPKAMVPDVACLPGPVDETHWTALCERQHATVRTGPYQGFVCETEALPDFVSLAEGGENLKLQVWRCKDADASVLKQLSVQYDEQQEPVDFGLAAMRLPGASASLNLLQGNYATKTGYQQWWRPLRLTTVLLLAWILLATAEQAFNNYRLGSEVAALETQNSELIARLFPEIKTLVPGNERIQLQRRMEELRGQGGSAGLFHALSALAQGLQSVGKLELQELQMRESTLYLNMTARDISTLEQLKAHFARQSDWELDVHSANASSDGVQIRASLRRAA